MKRRTPRKARGYRHRSAITGRFVNVAAAKRRPRTTIRERLK